MSDLNKEALDVWGALKPMIDQEISSRTQGMVQRRKAKVTTAPSLATNTIGVTEAFGDEMFLPFVSNMISAKVGDFVWIEWMYGATNAFVSSYAAVDDKNVSVAGVLDVVTRRCYNTSLSTSGWYRICVCNNATAYAGAEGSFVNFYITRSAGFTYNEVHKISLASVYNGVKFLGEESSSSVLGIDKIRATFNGTSRNLYVDIHYNLSRGNGVTARIDPYWTIYKTTISDGEKYWVAESMQSVADSPSGETVLTEYSFNANGTGDVTVNGVLDVVPRMCCATLSSEGWYRVMTCEFGTNAEARGGTGLVVDFNIVRYANTHASESHSIKYRSVSAMLGGFFSEESKTSSSNALLVDKIRYNYYDTKAYVDIHYTGAGADTVTCYFDCYVQPDKQALISSNGFAAVAASPANETVGTPYSFAASISPTYLKRYVDSTAANYTIGSGGYVMVSYPSGLTGNKVVSIGIETWTSNSGPFLICPYGSTNTYWYIIGSSGTTINGVKFVYWYID